MKPKIAACMWCPMAFLMLIAFWGTIESSPVNMNGWRHYRNDLASTHLYPGSSSQLKDNPFTQVWSSVISGSILTGDVTGDGNLEVVISGRNFIGIISTGGDERLIPLSDGLWRVTCLEDVTGDGVPEIVLSKEVADHAPELYFYSVKDSLFTENSPIYGEKGTMDNDGGGWNGSQTVFAVEDLDGDGDLEVVAVASTGYDLQPRGVYLYDYDSSKEIGHYNIGPSLDIGKVCIADIDGDNVKEIVFGSGIPFNYLPGGINPFGGPNTPDGTDDRNAWLFAVEPETTGPSSKTLIPKWPPQNLVNGGGVAQVSFSNLDHDDTPELIAFVSRSDVFSPPNVGGVYIVDPEDGSIIKQVNFGAVDHGAVADLNGDGHKEIIAVNSSSREIRVLDSDLNTMDIKVFGSPVHLAAVSDINGTLPPEIIATTTDGRVRVLDAQLEELWNFSYGTGGATVRISDMDGNGTNEIIVSREGATYLLQAPTTISTVSPASGPTEGGTSVTITGSNFGILKGAGCVTFGDTTATSYISWADTQIVCLTPAHVGGVVDVMVTADNGQRDTRPNGFLYARMFTVNLPGDATMEMVWMKPGTFTMGSPPWEPGRDDDEGPQHEVKISRGFWLGKYEITQGQWESVMGTRPWSEKSYVQENPNHPAVYISWKDVQAFIAKLNEAEGSEVYRLPTEAEWEYACRADTTTRWSFGEDESRLEQYAWYDDNTCDAGECYAHAVGTKLPNSWGLYDMHGNVYEWCQDWSGVYSSAPGTDPTGPASGSYRVFRGGSFDDNARNVRSASRFSDSPGNRTIGFGARLLRQTEGVTISSLSPTSGPVSGGTSVTIIGSYFGGSRDNGRVTFGDSTATSYISWADTQIVCVTPAHAEGSVDVVVTASNGLSGTKTGEYTYIAASVAAFRASPTGGPVPLTVSFTDLSTGPITSYSWSFGDGTTSTEQNPSHIYNSAGTFTVSLTVTGPEGSDTETRLDYIHVTESSPGSLKWKFKTGSYVRSSPAIGQDGTIYVGSDSLYAINPDGSLKWKFKTGRTPAIGQDGTVYVGSLDRRLYAINPDGSFKWEFWTKNEVWSSPAIGQDGTVCFASGDGCLYAINPDGSFKWLFETGIWMESSPAIGQDGTVYVGVLDNHLYAINHDGSFKWKFETGYYVKSSPAIGQDGTVYVGSTGLYAINPDGSLKWKFDTGGWVYSSPAIGQDGTIYVGSDAYYLYAVTPDGSLKWKFRAGGRVDSSPAIGQDGTVYVGSGDHYFYAVNPDGSLKWKFNTGDGVHSSPAIGRDGTVYVGSNDHYLYAVYSASQGLADSPWPMFGRDLTHTRRATGLAPDISLSATSHDFGDVQVGSSSTWTLVVSNKGNADLSVSSISSSDVQFETSPSSFTVAAGGSQNVTVTFTPASPDSQSATLTITNNDPDAGTLTVELSGRGRELPDAPTLSSPPNNSYMIDVTPTLTWNVPSDADGDSLHFKVEIAADPEFSHPISDSPFESRISTTGFAPAPPLPQGIGTCRYTPQSNLFDGEYYWRVSAWDGMGYGSASSVWKFIVDTAAPTDLFISINEGAEYVLSQSVTLTLFAPDAVSGVDAMMVGNSSDFSGVRWEKYTSSKSWTLSTGEGFKTVYVKFKDRAGNISASASDGIVFDGTPPTDLSLSINQGAKYTNSQTVTLTLSATDTLSGVDSMKVYGDVTGTGTKIYIPYSPAEPVHVTEPDGEKTVRVIYKDRAGNESDEVTDTVILDREPPKHPQISIDQGEEFNDVVISLTLSAEDADSMKINGDVQEIPLYIPYSTSIPATLTLPSYSGEPKVVKVRYKDKAGNMSSEVADTVWIKIENVIGIIDIDEGDYTNRVTIHLTLGAINADSMKISGDITEDSVYVVYSDTARVTLRDGEGPKTVEVTYKDKAGNTSAPVSDRIVFDGTPPTELSISINEGAEYTPSRNVTLTLSATDAVSGVDSMRISHVSDFRGVGWEVYAASKSWDLTSGEGSKSVYAQFKDKAGNISTSASDGIVFDGTPPTDLSLSINEGAETTTIRTVTLALSATDAVSGVEQIMVSNDESFSGVSWEAYATSMAWELTSGEGSKTVYAKFKDKAGNISDSVSDRIVFDETPPTELSISINEGAEYTPSRSVILTLSASDVISSVDSMAVSNDKSFRGVSWAVYATSMAWELTSGEGSKTVYAKFKDRAGNESTEATATILLDTQPPTGTSASSPDMSDSLIFSVNWGGGTDGEGSGLSGRYGVKVKDGEGMWTTWLDTSATSATCQGEQKHTYYFEAAAYDRAGNREAFTGVSEDSTFVDTTTYRARIVLSAERLSFGEVLLDSTSEDMLVIRNQGNLDLEVYDIEVDNERFAVSDTSFTVEPGMDHAVRVIFSPLEAGEAIGKLILRNNDRTVIVSLKGWGVGIPSILLTDVEGEQSGDVEITYQIFDDEGDEISLFCEYSQDSGRRWETATVTGKTTGIGTSGYVGKIIWNSSGDTPGIDKATIRFRITPSDVCLGIPDEIHDFHLDNNVPPSVSLKGIQEVQGWKVEVPYRLKDVEKDTLSLRGFYFSEGWEPIAALSPLPPEVYRGTLSWDVRKALGYGDRIQVRIRLVPADRDTGEAIETLLYVCSYLGDYDGDVDIDFDDLITFGTAWVNNDLSRNIGPARGMTPNLTPRNDGKIDFEDLGVFAMMWNWWHSQPRSASKSLGKLAAATNADVGSPIQWVPEVSGREVTLSILLSNPFDVAAYEVMLKYDAEQVKLKDVSQGTLFPQGSTVLFLEHRDELHGIVTVDVAYLGRGPVRADGERTLLKVIFEAPQMARHPEMEVRIWYDIRDSNGRKVAYGISQRRISLCLVPETFVLSQNTPNPFNATTIIPYQLPHRSDVTIAIYNLLGQRVRVLIQSPQDAGYHKVQWDGKDESGGGMASGIYFCRMEAQAISGKEDFRQIRKMLILR